MCDASRYGRSVHLGRSLFLGKYVLRKSISLGMTRREVDVSGCRCWWFDQGCPRLAWMSYIVHICDVGVGDLECIIYAGGKHIEA